MTPIERVRRIQEIMAKGAKATEAEKAEVKRLITEQMEWEKKNPSEAMALRGSMAIAAKTPEEMKAEYEAAQAAAAAKGIKFDPETSASFRETAAAAGIPESLLPKPVTPPSKFTPEMEDARTEYGKAVRARAIAAGKSPAVADAEALEAYRGWYPEMKDSGFAAPAAPVAEAPKIEYDANGWYFDKATGKWIPGPDAVYKKEEAKPTEAPAAPAPEPEGRGYGDRTREFEEVMNAARDESYMAPAPAATPTAPETPKEKPKFGDKIKQLGTKYGIPALEILEAVGYQRGGINKQTQLDKKYQEKLDKAQKEYMENLEKQREAREQATYEKRIAAEREWQQAQTAAAREADTAARREELSSRERLLRMQLDAQRAAARTGGTASIIPE